MRAELLRAVLENTPQSEVLGLLPESESSLSSLSELGAADMAEHLQNWEKAQAARLKHYTLQVSGEQQEVVDEAPMTQIGGQISNLNDKFDESFNRLIDNPN